VLDHLQHKRLKYARRDGEHVFDAIENARVAVGAEAYYRAMYYWSHESWNLRDRHMVGTLERLLQFYGPSSKAVVWAHNSHVGDASATDMAARGELNVGQLCRRQFGEATYIIGFGTDHGTVAAASYWDGPMEVKQVRPSHPHSYERVFHEVGLGVPVAAREARECRAARRADAAAARACHRRDLSA
jgi:erythromycin esterase-like protein